MDELGLEITNTILCEICYQNNANVKFDSCNHKLCLLCAENIDIHSRICPFDRISYNSIRCIACDKQIIPLSDISCDKQIMLLNDT